jgi:hypothetical protein
MDTLLIEAEGSSRASQNGASLVQKVYDRAIDYG